MATENSVCNYFLSTFDDSIYVFDFRLSGVCLIRLNGRLFYVGVYAYALSNHLVEIVYWFIECV